MAGDGTQANDRSADPAISDDGLVVAFFSAASNLVAGDANTSIWERLSKAIEENGGKVLKKIIRV